MMKMVRYNNGIGMTVTLGFRYLPNAKDVALVKKNNREYYHCKKVVIRRIMNGDVYLIKTPKMAFGPAVDFAFDFAVTDPVYVKWDRVEETLYLTIDTEPEETLKNIIE